MGKAKKTERNKQLVVKLVLIAIASVAVTALIQIVISATEISSTYQKLVMEELKATAEHLDSAVSSMNDEGDWEMVENQNCYNTVTNFAVIGWSS